MTVQTILMSLGEDFFKDLDKYCGVGFNRLSKSITLLTDCPDLGGIVYWDDETLNHLSALNLRGNNTIIDKQLIMFGYMCELLYDVMISLNDNVSTNPGFESVLGIFGNE